MSRPPTPIQPMLVMTQGSSPLGLRDRGSSQWVKGPSDGHEDRLSVQRLGKAIL